MNHGEPTLSTERLELTALTMADLDVVWPGVSDPLISENMSWTAHRDKEETRVFLKRLEDDFAAGKGITWGVRLAGDFCGIFSIISILRSHRALRYDRGELAYWCMPQHQGRGIMSEAGQAVIGYAFGKLGLNRLVVAHHLENVPSRKLIERLGFKPIGIEHQAFMKNGRWIDTKIYELLAQDHRS
jgi:RimJ/RimL family protein N-acetyltransferase